MKKVVISLAVIILGILLVLFYSNKEISKEEKNSEKNQIVKNEEKNINSQINNVEDNQQNEKTNSEGIFGSVGGGGSGSGSGGGAGGGSAGAGAQTNPQGNGCSEMQISYSLRNFIKNTTCNSFDGEICVDKTSRCSLEVQNLDDGTTGIFTIKFTHFELQDQNNILETEPVSFTLSPDQMKIFESETQIQSSGVEGNANKDISCTFFSEQIPKKVICG